MLAEEQAQVENIVNKPLADDDQKNPKVVLASDKEDGAGEDPAQALDDGFSQLLGGHTIGPLVQEYESHI